MGWFESFFVKLIKILHEKTFLKYLILWEKISNES